MVEGAVFHIHNFFFLNPYPANSFVQNCCLLEIYYVCSIYSNALHDLEAKIMNPDQIVPKGEV